MALPIATDDVAVEIQWVRHGYCNLGRRIYGNFIWRDVLKESTRAAQVVRAGADL